MRLSPEHLYELKEAKRLLEQPSLAARLTDAIGSPIERGFSMLPERWSATINSAVRNSLNRALEVAVKSLKKQKTEDDYQLVWRLKYTPGTIKAIATKEGKKPIIKEIKTAGEPAKITLEPDRNQINADGRDLSFVTVKVLDEEGTLVPHADNLINFEIEGAGFIAGVDNGCQTSHEPFKANYRKAFNGMCLVVVQAKEKCGNITLEATSEGLEPASVNIAVQ